MEIAYQLESPNRSNRAADAARVLDTLDVDQYLQRGRKRRVVSANFVPSLSSMSAVASRSSRGRAAFPSLALPRHCRRLVAQAGSAARATAGQGKLRPLAATSAAYDDASLPDAFDGVVSDVCHIARDFVAAASLDGSVRLWNARTGQLTRSLLGHEPDAWVTAVAALGTPGDWRQRILVSGDDADRIIAWNIEEGEPIAHLAGVHAGSAILHLEPLERRDSLFVSVAAGADAVIRDLASDEIDGEVLRVDTKHVDGVTVLRTWHSEPDRLITAGTRDRFVKVWDTRLRGQLVRQIDTGLSGDASPSDVTAIAGSTLLAVANSRDGDVSVYDTRMLRGVHPVAQLYGHADAVTCMATFNLAPLLATASKDETARVWNVVTGDCVARYQCADTPGDPEVRRVLAMPEVDGAQALVTATMQGRVLVWEPRMRTRSGSTGSGSSVRSQGSRRRRNSSASASRHRSGSGKRRHRHRGSSADDYRDDVVRSGGDDTNEPDDADDDDQMDVEERSRDHHRSRHRHRSSSSRSRRRSNTL